MAIQLTSEMIQAAQQNEQKYGVPASITLGQIILESSGSYEGGMSKLAAKANNLFGMKGAGNAGTYLINTVEEGEGGSYVTTAGFRKYKTIADSIDDHGRLLTTERYTSKTSTADTVEEYAKALQAAGYATDSRYAEKLINVIKSNDLTQYDKRKFGGGGGSFAADSSEESFDPDEAKLDVAGQLMRFIVVAALIILAAVFVLKGLGMEGSVL